MGGLGVLSGGWGVVVVVVGRDPQLLPATAVARVNSPKIVFLILIRSKLLKQIAVKIKGPRWLLYTQINRSIVSLMTLLFTTCYRPTKPLQLQLRDIVTQPCR